MEEQRVARTRDRNQLIIRILIVTGLRVSELANLRVEDVDQETGEILVLYGKGGKTRTVLVDPETLKLIRELSQGRDPKQHLIGLKRRQIQNIVKRYAVAAAVRWADYVSPHRLRDTFAVHWIRRAGDLESLRRLLGHNSLASTQKYLVFEFDEVKAAYSRIFGKQEKRRLYG